LQSGICIENDNDILETDELCIRPDGSFVTKERLRTEGSFIYEPFLVGVLHYILTKRAGKNELGIPTLDANTEKVKSKERKYNGHLGESISRDIKVDFYADVASKKSEPISPEIEDEPIVLQPDAIIEKSDDEVIREAMNRTAATAAAALSAIPQPKVNAEALAGIIRPAAAIMDACKMSDVQLENMQKAVSTVATALEANKHALAERIRENSRKEESASQTEIPGSDETASGEASEDKKTTIIQQQTNVIQNGDNNVNVTNNGTINFNF